MRRRTARCGNSRPARTNSAHAPSRSTGPTYGAMPPGSAFGRPEKEEEQEMFSQIDEMISHRGASLERLWEMVRAKRRELALCIAAAPAVACIAFAAVAAVRD